MLAPITALIYSEVIAANTALPFSTAVVGLQRGNTGLSARRQQVLLLFPLRKVQRIRVRNKSKHQKEHLSSLTGYHSSSRASMPPCHGITAFLSYSSIVCRGEREVAWGWEAGWQGDCAPQAGEDVAATQTLQTGSVWRQGHAYPLLHPPRARSQAVGGADTF